MRHIADANSTQSQIPFKIEEFRYLSSSLHYNLTKQSSLFGNGVLQTFTWTVLSLTNLKSLIYKLTGLYYKAVSRLRECCRQVEAEVIINSRNKLLRTWARPYSGALYVATVDSFCCGSVGWYKTNFEGLSAITWSGCVHYAGVLSQSNAFCNDYFMMHHS